MRKFLALTTITSLLLSGASFAYTGTDLDVAEHLASEGIINRQNIPSNYRLDSTISRAEAMKIALKIKGTTVPTNYSCKRYFQDVTKNDWICATVETAADEGIITRANAKFRPSDTITKAEALKIMIGTKGLTVHDIPGWDDGLDVPFFDTEVPWQRDVIYIGYFLDIIDINTLGESSKDDLSKFHFYPNRAATRAEVFGFAVKILANSESCENCENTHGQAINDIIKYPKGSVLQDKTLSFGSKVLVNGEGGSAMIHECIVVTGDAQKWGMNFVEYANILGMKKQNDIPYFTVVTEIGSQSIKVLGNNYEYIIYDHSPTKNCLSQLEFDNLTVITNDLVISTYYNFLNNGNIWAAYDMRSPAGVSFETFQSWYKNMTKADLVESSLAVLGDNTFEFQIQLTENGVVNTYKVKSKVNMDDFTIDNISSVKI